MQPQGRVPVELIVRDIVCIYSDKQQQNVLHQHDKYAKIVGMGQMQTEDFTTVALDQRDR